MKSERQQIEDEIISNLTPDGHQLWIGEGRSGREQWINEVVTHARYAPDGMSVQQVAEQINSDAVTMIAESETQEG